MSPSRARARLHPAGFACQTLPVFPDLLDLHALSPARYPHLLESVAHGTPQARYDILFAFPGENLIVNAPGGFLAAFDDRWREQGIGRADAPAGSPPFTGGWFVFLSYELGAEIEPALGAPPGDTTLPVALATRFPAAVIRDHIARTTLLVCEADRAAELLPKMLADLNAAPPPPTASGNVTRDITEDDPREFLDGVARVLDYIRAGDVFQANLSREWRAPLAAPVVPVELYRRLRRANPAPFAALMTLPGNRAVISSSPERLVRVEGNIVRTRPIAGTHPRGVDADEDRRLSRALLAHPKERAEHVMLIDLERNDLGRVCRAGTVRVPEFMVIESYRHVHHIVSEVSGELRPGVAPADVIRAVFPGGTITGCPKVRCMQIIGELERGPRGAYTGSLGYVNHDGSMDFNILIRTLVQDGDRIRLRAGAGIVADSVPVRELEETHAKAKGLLAALIS